MISSLPQRLYPTFARTRPPATFVSKSLASLLLRFDWTRVAFFHSNASSSSGGSASSGYAAVPTPSRAPSSSTESKSGAVPVK